MYVTIIILCIFICCTYQTTNIIITLQILMFVLQNYPVEFISHLTGLCISDCISYKHQPSQPKVSLVVITNDDTHSHVLNKLTHSKLYNQVVLIHSNNASNMLASSDNQAIKINYSGNGNHNNSTISNSLHSNSNVAIRPPLNHSIVVSSNGNSNSNSDSGSGSVYSSQTSNVSASKYISCIVNLIQQCERQHIMPRENILKKKLIDSSIGDDIDFDYMINVCSHENIIYVDGIAPDRVIWQRCNSNGVVNRFPCAD